MAEAAPHLYPELTIVLFHVHSSDKGIKAADRHDCLKKIIESVLSDSSLGSSMGHLFFLCQDKISPRKHKILCQELGQDPSHIHRMEKAGIYFRPSPTHTINYIDDKILQKVEGGLDPESDNPFTLDRLRACYLQLPDSEGGQKILLVSWHGPKTKANNKIERMCACFRRLICFCDGLRDLLSLDTVVIGGNFNLTPLTAHLEIKHKIAKEKNIAKEFNISEVAVLDDYSPTPDRSEPGNKVFIVCWPQSHLHKLKTHVVRPDLKREKGNRPFTHNIVAYKFGRRPSETAGQPASEILERWVEKWKEDVYCTINIIEIQVEFGAQIEKLREQNSTLEEQLRDQEMKHQKQIAELKKEIEEKGEEISTLEKRLTDQKDNEKQIAELNNMIEEKDYQILTLQNQLDEKLQN